METRKMAKPKKRVMASRGPKRSVRQQMFSFRGTPEYDAWFRSLADHLMVPASTLIEQSLMLMAEKHGYTKPPRR